MFFKNLPLSFSFAESTVLRLQENCKTFFVVILNGICLLALRVKTLRENYSCNYHYKPQARFSGDCDVQRRNLRIFLKGEAPSLLF